ncbi:MAG TPA: glutathione S-transferase family protein [Alphaproteobacteria bacterium]|nr:glutathione S-transferase family protein [Alphaproteobacteria bacterium]
MKLYDCKPAPNPRRVRIFLAEKGVTLETVEVDLRNGEQFSPAYRALNPQCVVPYLVLDDGTGIGEVEAICRYIEETHPSPPLFGADAKEKALVAMWEHRSEHEGLYAVGEAARNLMKGFKDHALPGPHEHAQIPALVERGKTRALQFLAELDARLAASEYIAGPRFSIADITMLVAVDFLGWLKVSLPEDRPHLKRWYDAVAARPSAKA